MYFAEALVENVLNNLGRTESEINTHSVDDILKPL